MLNLPVARRMPMSCTELRDWSCGTLSISEQMSLGGHWDVGLKGWTVQCSLVLMDQPDVAYLDIDPAQRLVSERRMIYEANAKGTTACLKVSKSEHVYVLLLD